MTTQQHTIAVVDDDLALRNALARQLSEHGYRVVSFPSAVDFLTAAAKIEARCLIVDINLGGTSGPDLVRLLSGVGLRFPIIFITGSDNDTIRTQCTALGCVAYLQKPLSEDRLNDALQKAIGSPPDPQ